MTPSAAGKAVAWTAAVSVAAFSPRDALIALAAAVAKEVFDLVSARMHRASVLAYLRTARAGTSLSVGPSSVAPALSLSSTSFKRSRPDGEEEKGAVCMPTMIFPSLTAALAQMSSASISVPTGWLMR